MEFNDIKTKEDFCIFFEVSSKFLFYHLQIKPQDRYKEKKIPKKSGGERIIHIPKPEYKKLLKKIKEALEKHYVPLDFVVGFVKKRSIIDGAQRHVNKRIIINVDLKDYFHKFNFGRVRGYFLKNPFNFNEEIATLLAQILTYDNILPMGSPTSPIVSNMIAFSLDVDLFNYCSKMNIEYTRYADDLTFSTNKEKPPRGLLNRNRLGKKIIEIVEKQGFEINYDKVTIQKKYVNQSVTNIVVNEKINLRKTYIKNLRASLHNMEKKEEINTIIQDKKKKEIKGKLNYLSMVRGKEDNLFLKYAQMYNDVFNVDEFDCDIITELENYIEERIVVITNDDETHNGTGFIIRHENKYFLVTATHVLKENEFFYYFYHKTRKNKKFMTLKTFSKPNQEEDIIIIELDIDTIDNFKHFKVTKKERLTRGMKIVVSGYEDYYLKTTTHEQIEDEIISTKTIFEHEKRYRLKSNSIRSGMSGGPIVDPKTREIVGVAIYGMNEDSLFSFLNKNMIERLKAPK